MKNRKIINLLLLFNKNGIFVDCLISVGQGSGECLA